MRVRLVLAALVLSGTVLPAGTASAAPSPAGVPEPDRQYLVRTHQANLFEIAAGALAEKGVCPAVRKLGPRFAVHHTALDADLVAVAAAHAVPLPPVPDPQQLGELAELGLRSGPEFDRTWLRTQFAAHVRSLMLGELEQRTGRVPRVRALAARSEPVLRHHLDEVVAATAACAVVTPG